MASMNNWLGFSLSPQGQLPSQTQDHQLSGTDVSGECFDLTSHDDSTLPSLNLPAPFGIFEAFNRNNQSQDWDLKDRVNVSTETNYKTSSEMSVLMDSSSHGGNQGPKLENFLGVGMQTYSNQEQKLQGSNTMASAGLNSNSTIGLSMIKNWLRNNPSPSLPENKNDGDAVSGANGNVTSTAQSLSLSMGTGSQPSSALPLLNGTANDNGGDSTGAENQPQSGNSLDSQMGAIEAVPRKSIDTFGQRTSIYRGVTRHRWTGRYEAHLWDNSCRREGQTRKGRQVYLGGYDKEEKAARAYDLAALKYWGTSTTTNFPISDYEKEIEEMKNMTRQEFVASLRRKSSGFSRGASIYRGVTRHHQHGRWQARIGRVAGNKDLYLGTFSTQEEAAEAYDIAAIKFRGLNAVTNFEISRYDVKSILESTTLPIGSTAKRLKDAAEQAEMSLDALRNHHDANLIGSQLTDHGGMNSYGGGHHHGWPTIAFHQQAAAQQLSGMRFAYGGGPQQQRLWCKQEHDDSDVLVTNSSFQDFHQLQLGNSHSFLQPSVLHNLMNLDSSTMEHSSAGSNSGIYSNGGGDANCGTVYGSSNNGYLLPMATVLAQGNSHGYGDHNEVKSIGYENLFGSSSDSYQARNLYYPSQQLSNGTVNSSVYDQSSTCNHTTWVPPGVPTLEARNNNMAAVCHGAQTFTVWNDTS